MPRIDYRLQIEGCPYEWVTSSAYALAPGEEVRERIPGLQYEGLQIEEQLRLRDFDIELSSMTVRIRHERALKIFAKRPNPVSYLTDDVDGTDTSFYVNNYAAFSPGYYYLGTECIKVTACSSNPITVERQKLDSQKQGHYVYNVTAVAYPPIYDKPPILEGRRCFLFMFLDGAASDEEPTFDFDIDPQGAKLKTTDKLIWRGIISAAPTLDNDGLTWLIHIEPITYVLDQEVAAVDLVTGIRGIYHSNEECIYIEAQINNGSWHYDTDYSAKISGFWENEWDLAADIQAALDTIVTNVNSDFANCLTSMTIEGDNPGHYSVKVDFGSAPPDEFRLMFIANAEGQTLYHWVHNAVTPGNEDPQNMPLERETPNGELAYNTGNINVFGQGGYRSWIFSPFADVKKLGLPNAYGADPNNLVQDSNSAYSPGRIYFSNSDPAAYIGMFLDPGDLIHVEFGGRVMNGIEWADFIIETIIGGAGDDYFIVKPDPVKTGPPSAEGIIDTHKIPRYWLDSETKIRPIAMSVAGSISDLRNEIVDKAVMANKGNTPFVTAADVAPFASILTGPGFINLQPWQLSRSYNFSKPITVHDIFREECKLICAYMCLTNSGRVTIKKMQLPVKTTQDMVVIDEDNIITPYGGSGMWPHWQTNEEGVVSIIEAYPSYDFESDDPGRPIIIKDDLSISTHKNRSRATLRVEPKSKSVGAEPNGDDIKTLANQLFSVLAKDYELVTVKVPFSLFNSINIGNPVLFASNHIPDTQTGLRGVNGIPALIVGRKWPLDGREGAAGEVTLWIESRSRTMGYAPALRIESYEQGSGNSWTLTVTQNKFAPPGKNDTSYFQVGDKVIAVQYDTAIPKTQTGVVTALGDNIAVVLFDGIAPWNNPTEIFDLQYREYPNIEIAQKTYTYIADNDLTVFDDEEAFVFA